MKVGYARVSTLDQDLTLQTDALQKAGCERIYTEKASGAKRDRPELKAALEYLREGDTLVVWKLDRLARSMHQLLETIEDFKERGIGLISLTQAIDTSTPGGMLIFHVFGALAEFERELIRERTMAGLIAARAQGRVGGRPPSIDAGQKKIIEAMLQDPNVNIKQMLKVLKIPRSTFYANFPRGRAGKQETVSQ